MPAQSRDPSVGQPTHDHTHTAEHEIFDEDSLREDQPYADLEDEIETTTSRDIEDSKGSGSW